MELLNENAGEIAEIEYCHYDFGVRPHDLRIRIGLQTFNLHRSTAEMRSKYLVGLMQDKPPTVVTDLVLDGIEAAVFYEICHWMYGGQLKIVAQNVCFIWNAAKKLQIDELVENCLRYLNTFGRRPSLKQGNVSRVLAPETKDQPYVGPEFKSATETPSGNAQPPKPVQKKRVSLEKLQKRKSDSVVPPSESDEWLTESEEETLGTPDPQIWNEKAKIEQKTALLPPKPPIRSYKMDKTRNLDPEMLLLRTSDEPKLAFLVARKHAEFLRKELEKSNCNTITVWCTSNQILAKVLLWSLDGCNPLDSGNIRAILQLTSQLQMHKLTSKSVEFWQTCLVQSADKAVMAQARSDWPLLGPYPFLVDLVTAKYHGVKAGIPTFGGNAGHAEIVRKAVTGLDPSPKYKLHIPLHDRTKNEPKLEPKTEEKKPTQPAIPNSIKIKGLRKTLALLKTRRTATEASRVPKAPKEVPKVEVPPRQPTETSRPWYSKNVSQHVTPVIKKSVKK